MQNRPSLMIPQLGTDPASGFPPPGQALSEPDGLLAWGGDLDPVRLMAAYRQGVFPWYSEGQPILWWNPEQRCVIEPGDVHVSRRLDRQIRKAAFSITADRAFEQVIEACARPRADDQGTWITRDMQAAYLRLHRMGVAHSIEAWTREGRLAGGIYGLSVGGVFCGESMFSAIPNASKVALVRLCRQLESWQFALIDCQVANPHLLRMGAKVIHRDRFLAVLSEVVDRPAPGGAWSAAFSDRA